MTGSPTVLLLATVGITVLLAPSLALFFGGRPDRRRRRVIAAAIPSSMLLATSGWMLLGSTLGVAAFQGALVATAVAVILAVGLRNGLVRGHAIFAVLWIALVLIPVGYALFDVVHGPLARSLGTRDFGGVSILALCTGTAALALALVSRGRGNAVGGAPHRSPRAFVLSAGFALLGWLAVVVGAELVLDGTTLTLAANELAAAVSGLAGWAIAQLVNVHRPTPAGLVAGLFAGSIVVLPAAPWLDTASVVVLGLVAGNLGHVAAAAARRCGMGMWATLIGVLLVPGAVGLLGAGIVARGVGLVFSGHADLVGAQAGGLTIVVGYSFIVSLLIALVVDRTMLLVGSSRHVDETIARLYGEINARDIDAVAARLHPDARDAPWARELTESIAVMTPVRSRRARGGWIEVDVLAGDTQVVHAFSERAGLFDGMQPR